MWFESVAQLVEHRPFKALVLGSSPSALTIKSTTYSNIQTGENSVGYDWDTARRYWVRYPDPAASSWPGSASGVFHSIYAHRSLTEHPVLLLRQ
jgi:hypothetical protein